MPQLTQLPDDVDLSFVAGDTFRIRVRVIDPTDASALPLDEYAFCAQIAEANNRSHIAAEFDITPDPDNPTTAVILSLLPAETAPLPGMGDGLVFHGLWDLQVTFPSPDGGVTPGDIRTVAQGSVTCYIDISCSVPPGS